VIRRNKKRAEKHQFNVRKGDNVLILSGKDKGTRGKVLKVYPAEDRVIVEGVSFFKRHTKPNPKAPQGGIVEREGKIHVSKVMVIDPKSGKPTRIGHAFVEADGGKMTRVRVAKVSGETLG
jgi:large subunit ribosomal protein L24